MTREEIQEKVLSVLLKTHRGTAALSGGTGKTLIGLKHMDSIYKIAKNVKFLVVAPKKSIFQSWKDDAVKFKLEHLLKHITFLASSLLPQQQTQMSSVLQAFPLQAFPLQVPQYQERQCHQPQAGKAARRQLHT